MRGAADPAQDCKEVSVLEAVTLAGGFSGTAAPAGVKVLRRTAEGKQETISIDLSGAVPRDKTFRIEDGDTVMVPRGNTFFVFGEVKTRGRAPISSTRRPTSWRASPSPAASPTRPPPAGRA